jgi:transposase, IS5 family
MREKRDAQASIFDTFCDHDLGRELAGISQWLDEHPEVCDWVAADLQRHDVRCTGRKGLSAESALRCALLKQYRQLSYEELAFHLLDSASFQAFARLPMHWVPKRSALQHLVASIHAQTWERINALLKHDAQALGVERGKRIRIDSTVTDAPIHPPSDSTLLWDATRVLVRMLNSAEQLCGAHTIEWVNHSRAAKKRTRRIQYTRGKARKARLYRELVRLVRATLGYVEAARMSVARSASIGSRAWEAELTHYKPLIERVIWQTEQRVFHDRSVPAPEKLVSLFEPHTDIVVKARREVRYGHKLNLVSGRSGLILDVVVESGNPADSERFVPMLTRHIAHYTAAPRQSAAPPPVAPHPPPPRRRLCHEGQSRSRQGVGRRRRRVP